MHELVRELIIKGWDIHQIKELCELPEPDIHEALAHYGLLLLHPSQLSDLSSINDDTMSNLASVDMGDDIIDWAFNILGGLFGG